MHINAEKTRIRMRLPDNWHAHFRQGLLLVFLVGIFIKFGWRRRIIAMPNLSPPNLTGELAISHCDEIRKIAAGIPGGEKLEPVPVMQITERTTRAMVRDANNRGVRVGKVYPFFVTTNSENGVKNYLNIYEALAEMEILSMIAEFHGEDPDDSIEGLLKEAAFLGIIERIRKAFPKLRIVLEHITTRKMMEWVEAQDSHYVAATITVHHLVSTIDDVIGYSRRSGGRMRVHWGCKPQPKFRDDQAALWEAVLSGDPRFFYGGDDAAHPKDKKECDGACGVWNTIAALSVLITEFLKRDAIHLLEPFLSEFGARFYGYPPNEGEIEFVRKISDVPKEILVPGTNDTIVPMMAGEQTEWEIVE